ncbi:MAG: polysaccharide deacetylase family protein [Firmicutes bacterium]|nr:polysaccharide deacetylase family protein [Bacillota bacterium]
MIVNRRRLFYLALLGVALALLVLTPLFKLPERLSQVLGRGQRLVPIYYVDTPEKKVAFSFDASWGAERTERILDILEEHSIKTTFFLTGFWVERYPHYVKLIAERGHEIGNHTSTHPHLGSCTAEEIREELLGIEQMIKELTGAQPTLFRAPFGEYNNQVITVAEELGYSTIQWSIDSLDWQNLTKAEIEQRVNQRAHRGAIILFHNNGLYTADALPAIIDYYRRHGYTILPISELIYHEDFIIEPHSGAQVPNPQP